MPSSRNILSPKIPRPVKPDIIALADFFLGGVADSPYVGSKNSAGAIVGFDIHKIPGLLIPAQKMTKEAGGAPTDDYYKILTCSDGNIYLFGKTNGKVYKNASGTYSLLGTVAPAAGSAGILDAIEFNSNIYYFMQSRVGEWTFANAFSTRNDSKFTFTNTNSSYHPALIVNNVLYVGDGNNVAQIDTTDTFTGAVFTTGLQGGQVVSALGKQVTDLLIGTTISNNVPLCHVFRWDTWSVSYINDYDVKAAGVNAFLPAGDSSIIIQAGLNGTFYILNGSIFEILKRIPSNFPTLYTPSNTCTTNYPATAVLEEIPIIGISNATGNPCLEGIYAFGSRAANYPRVLSLPYPISTGNLSGVTIWSLAVSGTTLYASSYDATTATYQIDKIDYTAKYASAYIESLVIKYSRIWLDVYNKIIVNYQQLPSGTDITVSLDQNWAGYAQVASGDIETDTDRNEKTVTIHPRTKTMRIKIGTTVSGNNAPYIEDAYVEVT